MRFRTFLLVIVLLIVLPGAGLTSAQNASITLWTILDLSNTNEPRGVLLKGFIEEFTQSTGIVVEVEQVAWNQISTRLAVAVQEGGDVPDLVETGSQQMPSLLSAGAAAPLDELFSGQGWLSSLNQQDADACVIDGVRYCVSHTVRGSMTFYRGADFPQGYPNTPEAMLAFADALPAGRDFLATFYAGRSFSAIERTWWPLIASNGGSIFDAEGKPNWATPEVVEVVDYGRALLTANLIPEVSVTGDFADPEVIWTDESASIFGGGTWSGLFIPGLRDAVESGTVLLAPSVDFGGGAKVQLNAEAWVIPTGAPNPAGAAAYLSAFMTPVRMSRWSELYYGIPTLEGASIPSDSPYFEQVSRILSTDGVYMQRSPYYLESLDALAVAWQELLLDPALDAQSHLQAAQDLILQSYW
ncbi:MAG: extracellular solute-binding protein [Anaerolineae bacterium]|nr:extracellular solute-binding protein [Anaerolineae bacterium]